MKRETKAMVVRQATISPEVIRGRILTFRGVPVMLDRDLAELYGVSTSRLNEQVKRNIERFPERFMFQLSDEEFKNWKSQIAISNSGGENMISQNPATGAENWISQNAISNLTGSAVRMGLRKRPFVFTEHGVTMLASVLHSETAVRVSIAVIDAFVAMRRFLISNADVFKRIETVERRQIADQVQNEERFKKVFKALDEKKEKVQGVFYDGQIWDAAAFVERLIASARKSLLLIDNWATVATLDMFTKKRKGVSVKIVTSRHINRKTQMPDIKILPADIAKFNAQYPKLDVCFSENFHDRFLIVDDKDVYLIGASLKDLAKKCFAFTKLDAGEIPGLKRRI